MIYLAKVGVCRLYCNVNQTMKENVLFLRWILLYASTGEFSVSLSPFAFLIPFKNTSALTEVFYYSVWQGNDVRMGWSNVRLHYEPCVGKETKGSLSSPRQSQCCWFPSGFRGRVACCENLPQWFKTDEAELMYNTYSINLFLDDVQKKSWFKLTMWKRVVDSKSHTSESSFFVTHLFSSMWKQWNDRNRGSERLRRLHTSRVKKRSLNQICSYVAVHLLYKGHTFV